MVSTLFLMGFGVAQTTTKTTILENSLMLLRTQPIQKEVGLSKAQMKSIEAAYTTYRNTMQSAIEKNKSNKNAQSVLQNLDASEQRKLTGGIIEVLSASQETRLRQLWIQFVGPFMLRHPEVAKDLSLTAAQNKAVETAMKEFEKKGQEITDKRMKELKAIPQPKDPKDTKAIEAYKKKVEALAKKYQAPDKKLYDTMKKQTENKMLATLTAAQKSKWSALQGKKYAFPKGAGAG